MTPDFTELLRQLKAGELDHLDVTPTEFPAFRAAWTNFPERKEIVGTASRGGHIRYQYHPKAN